MKTKNKQIVAFVVLSVLLGFIIEWLLPSGNGYASLIALKITLFLMVLGAAFAMRYVIARMNILYLSLSSEEEIKAFKENKAKKKINWSDWKSILDGLMASKPLAEENDIILDHDYDGIKELDNNLPPWWVYGFAISIVFAIFYMCYYTFLGGQTQKEEYLTEVKIAKKQIAAYEATQVKVDMSALAGGDNSEGKKLFKKNCAVCHGVDAGGKIGPNLTDNYWILGGSIDQIFHTISEGGRAGKGMIAWKNSFSPQKRQQLAAYVKSLKGSSPANPKAPQGELYKGE